MALHGYGDDPGALSVALAPATGMRWSVQCPTGPVVVPGGAGWFDPGAPLDDAVATPLRASLRSAVADAAKTTAGSSVTSPPARLTTGGRAPLVIGGFSQGGAAALLGALDPDPVTPQPAGAFVLDGFLPSPDGRTDDWARVAGLPVLVVHHTHDTVVPVQHGRSLARVLERRGAHVTTAEVPGMHGLDAALLERLAAWLDTVLEDARDAQPGDGTGEPARR